MSVNPSWPGIMRSLTSTRGRRALQGPQRVFHLGHGGDLGPGRAEQRAESASSSGLSSTSRTEIPLRDGEQTTTSCWSRDAGAPPPARGVARPALCETGQSSSTTAAGGPRRRFRNRRPGVYTRGSERSGPHWAAMTRRPGPRLMRPTSSSRAHALHGRAPRAARRARIGPPTPSAPPSTESEAAVGARRPPCRDAPPRRAPGQPRSRALGEAGTLRRRRAPEAPALRRSSGGLPEDLPEDPPQLLRVLEAVDRGELQPPFVGPPARRRGPGAPAVASPRRDFARRERGAPGCTAASNLNRLVLYPVPAESSR